MVLNYNLFSLLALVVVTCCIKASIGFTTTPETYLRTTKFAIANRDEAFKVPTTILFASALSDTASSLSVPLESCRSPFLLSEGSGSVLDIWNNFQDNHTFLQGLLLTIAIKIIVGEVRRRVEKPIMDEAGRRIGEAAKEQLTPDTQQIDVTDWAKLGACVTMDLAGDASELIPFLGEFTDVAFAPAEAAMLQLLFKSPFISAFGFAEEILPFTDVVPTFTMSWILSTLFPTTPLAKNLLPAKDNGKS